jgi:hypothetical protein
MFAEETAFVAKSEGPSLSAQLDRRTVALGGPRSDAVLAGRSNYREPSSRERGTLVDLEPRFVNVGFGPQRCHSAPRLMDSDG